MKKIKISNVFIYIFLSVASFISIFPFYWMIVSSTNRSFDITMGRLLPGNYLFNNIQTMLNETNFLTGLWNSARIAVIATVLTLLLSSMAGYAFEIYKSKWKDIVFRLLLLSMMIPTATMIVPLFLMLATVSNTVPAFGLDTIPAIIIPGLASVFLIFFFRQSTKMFATDVLEAARIDGMGELGMFFRIYMPIMKNTYAAAAIITFMGSWNAFLWPRIVIRSSDLHTLPIVLNLVNATYTLDFGLILLVSTLSIIPMGIVFFVLQKHFVAGMMGSSKG